jgi:hypothetical protein
MFRLKMWYRISNMNETQTPESAKAAEAPKETSLEEAGIQIQEMSDSSNLVNFHQSMMDATERLVDTKANIRDTVKNGLIKTGAVAATVASAAGLGNLAGEAFDHNFDQQQQQGQQMQEDTNHQQRLDDLDNGKITIEVPAPAPVVTEIPPVQQIDQQLPTLNQ